MQWRKICLSTRSYFLFQWQGGCAGCSFPTNAAISMQAPAEMLYVVAEYLGHFPILQPLKPKSSNTRQREYLNSHLICIFCYHFMTGRYFFLCLAFQVFVSFVLIENTTFIIWKLPSLHQRRRRRSCVKPQRILFTVYFQTWGIVLAEIFWLLSLFFHHCVSIIQLPSKRKKCGSLKTKFQWL